MPNILLITEHFPPERTAGSNRPYSLYKYLGQYGINVFVVTKKFNENIKHEPGVSYVDSFINWREMPMLSAKRLRRYLNAVSFKFLSIFNDDWWYRKALVKATTMIREHNIDLIYATFPGAEAIRLGAQLQKRTRLPLITEFRDGLVFESIIHHPNKLQRKAMVKLERDCVEKSTAIITIGKNLSAYFKTNYETPVYTVYNGYDKDDFNDMNGASDGLNVKIGKRRIVFFGALNAALLKGRLGVFEAIKQLKAENLISPSTFELVFIGNTSTFEKDIVEQKGIADVVTFYPSMNKKEGFGKIRNEFTHLLLYGVEGHSTVVSSKLLEYLMLDKPVLGICKGNEAELVIQQTGVGEVCDFDVESIKKLLVKSIKGEISYKPDSAVIRNFDRECQSREIASIIQKVIVK